MNKPHLIDWATAGISTAILGSLAYMNIELSEVKVNVAEMTGKIEYETTLLKDLNEEYQDLTEKVDSHEIRIALLEATTGGDVQR